MGSNIDDIKKATNKSTYVTDVNNNFDACDTHDHSDGSGLPVKRLDSTVVTGTSLQITSNIVSVNEVVKAKLASGIVDDSSLEIDASNGIQIKDGGITQAKVKVRPQTTNGSDPGEGGIVFSSGVASYSANTGTGAVPGSEVTLTTTGNPVMLMLIPNGTSASYIFSTKNTGTSVGGNYTIWRDSATEVHTSRLRARTNTGFDRISYFPGVISTVDFVSAGTYTWDLRLAFVQIVMVANVTNVRLVAWELL